MGAINNFINDPVKWSKIKDATTLDDAIEILDETVSLLPLYYESQIMYGRIKQDLAMRKYAAFDYGLKALKTQKERLGRQAEIFQNS